MGYNDNTVAGGVRFSLLGESLGDGGEILGVRKTVHVSPVIDHRYRGGPLELSTEASLPSSRT